MTDEQKYAMENLRCLGFGYKKIAAETGLSEGTVKSYFHRLKDKGEIPVMRPVTAVPSKQVVTAVSAKPEKMTGSIDVPAKPSVPVISSTAAVTASDGSQPKPSMVRKQWAKPGQQIICKPCLYCGKPVAQNPGRKEKKFCSDSCKGLWWNRNKYTAPRKSRRTFVCQSCGEEFTAYGTDNRKYCSHACYISARFRGGAACV